jgi:metal transporter CNNM
MDYLIIAILLTLSGLFSGLTIGLVGLPLGDIIRASELGDNQATKVLEVKKDANLLLVTLLLGNTAINSTLAIFLGAAIGPGVIAGVVSTFLIMIFGEILPASIISQHPLKVGSAMAPLVKVLMGITYPITKPIAMALDKYVGTEGIVIINRAELRHIVEQLLKSKESDIDELDRQAMVGTILLSEKKVGDHMSKNPYTLDSETPITQELFTNIKEKGYTRIPVIKDNEVVGILNAKDLIGMGGNGQQKVKWVMNKNNSANGNRIFKVDDEAKLDDVMNYMIKNHIHIAMVKSYEAFVGVITLEDILEEVLLTEIIDEFDN